MQRKRDGLVPIGETLSDLGGPLKKALQSSPRSGTTSPASIKWTNLSGPVKRTPISASWRG